MKEQIIVCELDVIQDRIQSWLDIGYSFKSIQGISEVFYLIIVEKDQS